MVGLCEHGSGLWGSMKGGVCLASQAAICLLKRIRYA